LAPILAPPPLLFLVFASAAWGTDTLWWWHLEWVPFRLRAILAAALVLLSACLGGWAIWGMMRAKTPVEPWKPTKTLLFRGPFRFSRNPIYIGMVALFLAAALVVDSGWFYAASPLFACALHFGVVLREEAYLKWKFGQPYEDYRKRVRRWM
jgi:protein-S-isoprenylcysteine O-methyltransferase Ste14